MTQFGLYQNKFEDIKLGNGLYVSYATFLKRVYESYQGSNWGGMTKVWITEQTRFEKWAIEQITKNRLYRVVFSRFFVILGIIVIFNILIVYINHSFSQFDLYQMYSFGDPKFVDLFQENWLLLRNRIRKRDICMSSVIYPSPSGTSHYQLPL